jgi:hypothetical protein
VIALVVGVGGRLCWWESSSWRVAHSCSVGCVWRFAFEVESVVGPGAFRPEVVRPEVVSGFPVFAV